MTAVALDLIPAEQLGTAMTPVVTHVARSYGERLGQYDLPPVTLTGVACGECSRDHRRGGHRGQLRHADVAAVRACVGARQDMEAEARAEALLFRREQAYWDNGGAYADAISRDAAEEREREGHLW